MRAYGTGGLHQRKDGPHAGRWEFRRTIEGKRRTATFPDRPTLAQQRAAIAKWSQSSTPSDPESVGEYLERWLRDGQGDNAPRTVSGYRALVRDHIAPVLGNCPLRDLSAPDVQRLVNRHAGAPRTRLHVLACLRAALSQAVRWGLLDRNVASAARGPKIRATEPRTLSPAETKRFLAQCKGDPLEPLYVLAAMTGMRQGEVLGLRWQDVQGDTLTVNTSLWWRPGKDGREPVLTLPKTTRSRRTLHLQPELVSMLRDHRKRQLETRREVDDALVFTDRHGVALQPTVVLYRMRKHLQAAGLPPVRFHALRHGAASMLLADGVPVNLVSEMLGHSNASTTLNVYGHVLESAKKEVAGRMGRLLREETA